MRYDIPRGCAAGYMPELNVLCPIGDFSRTSRRPVMKHIPIEITLSSARSPHSALAAELS